MFRVSGSGCSISSHTFTLRQHLPGLREVFIVSRARFRELGEGVRIQFREHALVHLRLHLLLHLEIVNKVLEKRRLMYRI